MSERLLPEVLDFFENRHREDVKSCRRRLLMLSVALAITIPFLCVNWEKLDSLSLLNTGFVVGAWFWILIDYLSARHMLAAYLRYEYEMKILANIPEEEE